jgi:predicted PhzF superfamily epimerase YddE/YHI9
LTPRGNCLLRVIQHLVRARPRHTLHVTRHTSHVTSHVACHSLTPGACHAWLARGGRGNSSAAGAVADSHDEVILQQCGIGVVEIRRTGSLLSFAAPKFLRHEPLSPSDLDRIHRGLNLTPDDIVASHWIDNGPGWRGIVLKSDAHVRALSVDGGWVASCLLLKLFSSFILF